MTNGGFDTMRSNTSPATGSNRLPSLRLDPVDVVEQRVQPCETERTRRDVGGDDVVDAAPRAERLDAASRADVEAPLRRASAAAATRGSARLRRRRAHGLREARRRVRPRRDRSRSTTRRLRSRRRTTAGARVRADAHPRRFDPRGRGGRARRRPCAERAAAVRSAGCGIPSMRSRAEHGERVGALAQRPQRRARAVRARWHRRRPRPTPRAAPRR